MKYFFTVSKVVYTLFYILTIGMLILAIRLLLGRDSPLPFARYYSYIYLAVLLITLVTIIINVVIVIPILMKRVGILKVVKRVGPFFIVGFVIAIILSFIKYKILFSMDFLFLPISFSIGSIIFSHKET